MPKAIDAMSKLASSKGNASASATSNRTFNPARLAFSGAAASISWQKSTPTTVPLSPTRRLKASARSPVPVAQSRTESPALAPLKATAARRHSRWIPKERTSLVRS
jgi:hypothetical protein